MTTVCVCGLQILSDTEKRHHYDMTGEVEDSPNVHRGPTVFQRGNVFHFQFNRADVHRADSVTTQAFFNRILPESDHRLFLLFFYHDLCFQCAEVERAWAGLRSVSVGRAWAGCSVSVGRAWAGLRSMSVGEPAA